MEKYFKKQCFLQLMRPESLKAKIFLDGCDPSQTKKTLDALGFLDGQTTNPSSLSKNPSVQERITNGGKLTRDELLDLYESEVREISKLAPDVSVEVYADRNTKFEFMVKQALEMYEWADNLRIKLPITTAGLEAAEILISKNVRINMTLCFTQDQAAAVYALRFANDDNGYELIKKGNVYISPFVGRLDDRGDRGVDLVRNIKKMYQQGDGHVDVLGASVRTVKDLVELAEISDIVTAPYDVLMEWNESGMHLTAEKEEKNLRPISYENLNLRNNGWQNYPFFHSLIGTGVKRFADDWNSLLTERYDK